jgi:hypothetical protein
MSEMSIEQRLTAVETAVSDLQRRLANIPPSPNWLEQITGSFKNRPAFEKVLKYGQEWRQADQLPEEPEASA